MGLDLIVCECDLLWVLIVSGDFDYPKWRTLLYTPYVFPSVGRPYHFLDKLWPGLAVSTIATFSYEMG